MKSITKLLAQIVFLFFTGVSCSKKVNCEVHLVENNESMIVIPMKLNGRTHNFIWDSGTTISCIFGDILTDSDIEMSKDSLLFRLYQRKQDAVYYKTKKVNVQIGDGDFSSTFLVSDDFGGVDSVSGVIGQDIINLFYWEFDWSKNRVAISSAPFIINDTPVLTLESDKKSQKLPYVNLLLNDTTRYEFFIDTGMPGVDVKYEDLRLFYDFKLYTSGKEGLIIWNSFVSVLPNKMQINTNDAERGRVFDSIQINNFHIDKAYIVVDDHDFYKGISEVYVSLNFFKRFSRMYYDPFNHSVKLYIDTHPDHNLYSGKDIDEYFKLLHQTMRKS